MPREVGCACVCVCLHVPRGWFNSCLPCNRELNPLPPNTHTPSQARARNLNYIVALVGCSVATSTVLAAVDEWPPS